MKNGEIYYKQVINSLKTYADLELNLTIIRRGGPRWDGGVSKGTVRLYNNVAL